MKCVYMTLPSKKLVAKRMQSKESSVCTSIQKDLRKLGKICHKYAERVEQAISKEDQCQFNTEIEQINSRYELQIDKINEMH